MADDPHQIAQVEEPRRREFSNGEIIWMIFLLSAAVLILSLVFFSAQSLRLDEAQSLWQTSHGLKAMLTTVSEDVHVPLYHIMLHVWQIALGNGVPTARYLSLIFYILMIPATYLLAERAFGERVGLFSALLIAISPFLNWYGNEIRMYSLFTLMTILNQYFFISILLGKREADGDVRGVYWFGFAATAVLGMFTHYFFVWNVVTEAIFFILYRRYFPKRAFLTFFLVAILVMIVFAPWLYFVYTEGSASNTQPLLAAPTSIDVFNTFSQFIFGFQNDHTNTILVSLWPLLVLLIFLSLRRNAAVRPETVYFFLSLFIPILLSFAVSLEVKPIYLTRYLILTIPSLYILISWVLSTYPRRLARSLRILIFLAMVVTMGVEIANAGTPVKEDYRAASDYISAHATPEDVIVLSAPFTVYPFEYYYSGPADVETLPIWDQYVAGAIPPFSEATLPTEVNELKDAHQTMWLILSYDQGYEQNIKTYFDTHFEQIDKQNFSPGLDLYAYKLRYDDENLSKILREINSGVTFTPPTGSASAGTATSATAKTATSGQPSRAATSTPNRSSTHP